MRIHFIKLGEEGWIFKKNVQPLSKPLVQPLSTPLVQPLSKLLVQPLSKPLVQLMTKPLSSQFAAANLDIESTKRVQPEYDSAADTTANFLLKIALAAVAVAVVAPFFKARSTEAIRSNYKVGLYFDCTKIG